MREIELACEQSKVLLTKIDEIENIYHKCLREDKRLTEDQLQLFEHFGFIIPPGLVCVFVKINQKKETYRRV